MTGQELLNFLNNLLDDSVDQDFGLDLLNNAKDIIEADRPWRMLLKEDSSNTFGSSDDYLTAKSLPSDFLFDVRVLLGIESNDDYRELDPIPFERRREFANTGGKYVIDVANSNLYVCDSVSDTYTIYLYYIYKTPDITLTTEPVWPSKFHRLIAFLAAELYKSGVDFDDVNVGQALAHNKQAIMLFNAMKYWDNKLKLRALGGRTRMSIDRTAYRTDIIKADD